MSETEHHHPTTDIDEEALADTYNFALEREHAGDIDAAVEAYRRVLEIDPRDRGGVSVRLAALGHGEIPAKAPDAYVVTLFDQHSDVFETILVDQLGYCVPLQARALLDKEGLGPFERGLDLGCGTGLAGEALRDRVVHFTGVDISEGMVEVAYDKNLYDDLYVGEAVAFLEEAATEDAPYDLIIATDVLPYLGDATALFDKVAANLVAAGLFCFSTETLPDPVLAGRPYMVGPGQRFAHALDYLRNCLAEVGLTPFVCDPIVVRHQEGVPVPGHLILARKAT